MDPNLIAESGIVIDNLSREEAEIEAARKYKSQLPFQILDQAGLLEHFEWNCARIRAEAKAEAISEAVELFWKELHEEAEKQYDRRLELLGPIETPDDAAFRKTLHDGWSAWLLAKRIVTNRHVSTLDYEPNKEE